MSSEPNKIGSWGATSLVVGNMIGSGIFLLPAALAAYGGISIIGWLISCGGAILLAIVFAQLSKLKPMQGGPYAYTRESFGDFPSFLVALGYWISICCTNAAIAIAMVGYLTVFLPPWADEGFNQIMMGIAAICVLTWVNLKGIKQASWIQIVTTILKVASLLLVILIGAFMMNWDHFQPLNLSDDSAVTVILTTATLTLFAFLGVECATIPANNIKSASTNIPKSTINGTLIAAAVYVLGSVVVMGIIPPEILINSNAPFADAAEIIGGTGLRYVVAIGAIISTFGALNGWILMQGQIPLSAADDKLFPAAFSKLNVNGSPVFGLILSSVIVCVILITNYTKGLAKAFEFMILLSTLTVLVPYLFSTAAHTLVHLKMGKNKKWLISTVAFIFSMLAVIGSGETVVYWGFIFLMSGIPFYVWIKK